MARPIKVPLRQFVTQWSTAGHVFRKNLHNVEVMIGRAAVDVFKGSFEKHRFNTQGSTRWKPYDGHYLHETGTLKNSIKLKGVKRQATGDQVIVYTDPNDFSRAARHKGFCYAGVHNDFDKLAVLPKRGPKYRRQFIGDDSTVLEKEVMKISVHLFDGLPH